MDNYSELLREKFRIVEKGLDPDEVIGYLSGESGSNDTIFRQLERFSALQAANKTLDDAINHVRDLAEHAKVKATQEAEQLTEQANEEDKRIKEQVIEEGKQLKEQAIEEGKQVIVKIINEIRSDVLTKLDKADSIIIEAMNETFEKTKEQVAIAQAEMCKMIEKVVEAEVSQTLTDMHKIARESDSQPETTDHIPVNMAASEASSTSSDPWKNARG